MKLARKGRVFNDPCFTMLATMFQLCLANDVQNATYTSLSRAFLYTDFVVYGAAFEQC